jgi:hypothetical protein
MPLRPSPLYCCKSIIIEHKWDAAIEGKEECSFAKKIGKKSKVKGFKLAYASSTSGCELCVKSVFITPQID